MKLITSFFLLLLVFGVNPSAWAGAEEEVAQIVAQRNQFFNEGNLEAYMAGWADNGVYTPSLSPFRIEGKEALRAFYTGVFQTFPTRRFIVRQRSIRVYGGTTAVANMYFTLILVDREGKARTTHGRFSGTYVKLGDRWLAVDTHTSSLPASP